MIEHCVFAYNSFVKNNMSITPVQHEFRCHFNIHRNQAVPAHNTILRWAKALHTQGTLMNKRSPGARQWYILLKMWNASDKPCYTV